jgi:hypothetical protein
LFRIASRNSRAEKKPVGGAESSAADFGLLAEFCVTDYWAADLSNAMLDIGPTAKHYLGLDSKRDRFGLLEFIRCHDRAIHQRIILLFEQAAAHAKPFHFSAELHQFGAGSRIVHCYGDYRMKDGAEELYGALVFTRDLFNPV